MTVISNFHGISTEKSIYGIMFVIQGDLQGQKVNSKLKFSKILFSIKTSSSKCNTYFYVILIQNAFVVIHLVISRTSYISNSKFQDKKYRKYDF